ncbi:MAG: winged helix-turn-helix transcriptional regulator [Peptococcaceae bacterium]|nr:winged helix-turn-helix transcriptional regulator [Peptococcaceae bacterium]
MKDIADRFKALAEPTRLKILRLLHKKELCVCEIAEILRMSQPRVSQHLKVLRLAGFIRERKVKLWSFYSLVSGAIDGLFASLQQVMQTPLEKIPGFSEEAARFEKLPDSEVVARCRKACRTDENN